MLMVLFIVGPPGSGKSRAYRIILDYLQETHIERINDYAILMRMCDEDVEHERFIPTKRYKGFTVIDLPVFEKALQEANQEISKRASLHRQSSPLDDFLLIVEFSRNNYQLAFDQFDKDNLIGSFFLLITVDMEESHRRLKERLKFRKKEDNHFVPSKILHDYYDKALPYAAADLAADFDVPLYQIEEIDNNGTLDEFKERIHRFIDAKIKQKAHL